LRTRSREGGALRAGARVDGSFNLGKGSATSLCEAVLIDRNDELDELAHVTSPSSSLSSNTKARLPSLLDSTFSSARLSMAIAMSLCSRLKR
jgi:hypothetical protein